MTDLRYAIWVLLKKTGFTAAAMLTHPHSETHEDWPPRIRKVAAGRKATTLWTSQTKPE